LATSLLTFDDLDGSKIKVMLFDVKYVKNGNSYHAHISYTVCAIGLKFCDMVDLGGW